MSIYHFHMSNVSRKSGGSALATESYITGQACHDERTGKSYSYGRRQRVAARGILLPKGAPADWNQRGIMMNAAERECTRNNARVAKKIEAALPVELSKDQMTELIESFAARLIEQGYGVIWALHTDKENTNPHVHYEIVNQQIDENGNWIKKWDKSRPVKERTHWLDRKTTLEELRSDWAAEANHIMERCGIDSRIDHRSYKDQGSALTPTQHEGYKAHRREALGQIDPVCAMNRRIRAANARLLERRVMQQAKAVERDRLQRLVLEADPKAPILVFMDELYPQAVEHYSGRRDVIIASSDDEKKQLEEIRAALLKQDQATAEKIIKPDSALSLKQDAESVHVEEESIADQTNEETGRRQHQLQEYLQTGIESICRWIDRELQEIRREIDLLTERFHSWIERAAGYLRGAIDRGSVWIHRSEGRAAGKAAAGGTRSKRAGKCAAGAGAVRTICRVVRDLVDVVRTERHSERMAARSVQAAAERAAGPVEARNAALSNNEKRSPLTGSRRRPAERMRAAGPSRTPEKAAIAPAAPEEKRIPFSVRVARLRETMKNEARTEEKRSRSNDWER